MKYIYLDYAATTPVDPEVIHAMTPYFGAQYGNPSSLHSFGQEAIAALDNARETITKSIGYDFRDIIFTGSATEANNLVLRGVVRKFLDETGTSVPPRIVVSSIEHESILETARILEKEGVEVVKLKVNKEGLVSLKELEKNLTENTVLVSVMYANNEVGVVQDISKIAQVVRNFRNSKLEARNQKQIQNLKSQVPNISNFDIRISDLTRYPLLHTDAVQAFQYLNCNVNSLGVDLMTLSAHKVYGPKGVGALYVRNSKLEAQNPKQIQNLKSKVPNISNFDIRISDLPLSPITVGGGQEYGLRSGTENVAGIVGFAKAVELADKLRTKEAVRVSKLRNELWAGIKKIFPKALINGSKKRLPNNLNIYLPGKDAQFVLTKLDLLGIAASAGSACVARALTQSHVIKALYNNDNRAKQSIRFTLGKYTTSSEIKEVVARCKKLSL